MTGKKSDLTGDRDYRKYLRFVFEYGGLEERKLAISGIKSTIVLKDEKVRIDGVDVGGFG